MKTKAVIRLSVMAWATLVCARAWSQGVPGCGIEGGAADPPSFGNCTACHNDHRPNSGDGSVRLSGVPPEWSAGTTYRISGILADPGQRLWGFHVTAIGPSGSNAGSLVPADGNTTACSQNGRVYLSQTGQGRRGGTLDGPVNFDFDWVAPAAGTGTVVFYAQGIACNFDSMEGGDFTYTAAVATVEAISPGTGVTVVLQPDATVVTRGSDLVVRVRIENHGATARSVYFASRLRRPSGQTYPPSGFLQPPMRVDLGPGEQATRTVSLHIPPNAPAISVRWETLVGVPQNTLLAQDSFAFTVQ